MGQRRVPLTVEQILAWADAHHARTGGWPSANTGGVAGVPGQSWAAIDEALRRGLRGLPGGDTLARLLDRRRGRRPCRGRPWTPGDDALVRALPAEEAARRTGRSLLSVYTRRHVLGLAFARRWTPAEDRLARTHPVQEVAERTGRTPNAVYLRRHALGVARRHPG